MAGDGECVLEGLHAVKHAIRFGARLRRVVSSEPAAVLALAGEVAPDVAGVLRAWLQPVTAGELAALAGGRRLASPVLGVADRRTPDAAGVLARDGRHVVLLEDPRHAGNAGAVVRVAAAAGARGVLMTGALDPWSAPVVRASAGLHYALDVAGVAWPAATARAVVAFDPEGEAFDPAGVPEGAVLAFGGERHGLSAGMLAGADRVVRLPMAPGVSSLNLATCVAAALYALRYHQGSGPSSLL